MIIYNTTYVVDVTLVETFLEFMRNTYNPEAMKSGIATNSRLSQIMSSEDESVINFAYQFEIETFDDLDLWYSQSGQNINEKLVATFADKVIGFSTLMEVVDL